MGEAEVRSRWPQWPTTASVVGVITVGGAAAVAKWPHAWWWLVVVMVVAAAVLPPVLVTLTETSRQRRRRQSVARNELQSTTGPHGSKLRSAANAGLEARVHPTILPIPYIRRDEESTIRDHLRQGRPVLLIGSSMVGKTKMAARVIVEEFGSWPAVIPDKKTVLAALNAQDVALRNAVVWLDDVDRLIDAGGITDGSLRRLVAAGNLVVATIRARAYNRLLPSDELRLPEWDALCVFEHVFISRDLTPKEEERLADAVDDPAIRDRIRTVGLGEYVGAAGQVSDKVKLGAAGTEPLGYALVLAAADWRRSGMTRPIPASLLAPLAKPHLDHRGQAQLADKDAYDTGLDWATRPINPNVSLLQPAGADSYIVYDYALDLISAQAKPIPDSSWAVIAANAEVGELWSIGYTASVIYRRIDLAMEAFRKMISSPDAEPLVLFNLGLLLEGQGDVEGANNAYQRAIDSEDAEAAPRATNNLGLLKQRQGDLEGAKNLYQKAIDSGNSEAAARAVGNLGLLLADHGDVQGAKDVYQKAIDSGTTDQAARATLNLGLLLERQGDLKGAKDAYQKAVASQDQEAAPRAAGHLGRLLADQGDVRGAKSLYEKVIDSGHPQAAAGAAGNLGLLLADQGDVQGAKEAFQKAIDSEVTEEAATAAYNLGLLLADQGDVQGAKEAFQKVVDSEVTDLAASAATRLRALSKDDAGPKETGASSEEP
jgi:tetratricopeptide (TPR) repeat protein